MPCRSSTGAEVAALNVKNAGTISSIATPNIRSIAAVTFTPRMLLPPPPPPMPPLPATPPPSGDLGVPPDGDRAGPWRWSRPAAAIADAKMARGNGDDECRTADINADPMVGMPTYHPTGSAHIIPEERYGRRVGVGEGGSVIPDAILTHTYRAGLRVSRAGLISVPRGGGVGGVGAREPGTMKGLFQKPHSRFRGQASGRAVRTMETGARTGGGGADGGNAAKADGSSGAAASVGHPPEGPPEDSSADGPSELLVPLLDRGLMLEEWRGEGGGGAGSGGGATGAGRPGDEAQGVNSGWAKLADIAHHVISCRSTIKENWAPPADRDELGEMRHSFNPGLLVSQGKARTKSRLIFMILINLTSYNFGVFCLAALR